MITTNYQTYGTSGFNLRLRIYQDGETRYVNLYYSSFAIYQPSKIMLEKYCCPLKIMPTKFFSGQ